MTSLEIWDQEFTSHAFTRTVDNFWDLVLIFIEVKFENNTDMYEIHKENLLAVVKKKEMTVTAFESQLKYHNNSVLPLLPGAPADQNDAMFNDWEFKVVVYKAMSGTWHESFGDFHTLSNSTLQDIKTFMERQHLKANNARKKDDSHGNPGCGRGNGNGPGGGRGRGRGKGRDSRGKGKGNCNNG